MRDSSQLIPLVRPFHVAEGGPVEIILADGR